MTGLLTLAAPALAQEAGQKPMTSTQQFIQSLNSCWIAPAAAVEAQAAAVVQIRLDEKGYLRGDPRVLAHPDLDEPGRQAMIISILKALDKCTPFRLSGEIAPILQNRLINIRFDTKVPTS